MTKNLLPLLLIFFSVNVFCQSFNSRWNTVNIETGSSAADQVTIPINPAYTTYNYDVDWGDGTSDTGVTGAITHTYLGGPGTYTISISGDFPAIYFNDEEANDKLKIIEILQWGNIQWRTMENAFYGCENVNFDAIDAPNLTQVTSLQNMFRHCTVFNGIVNNWDVSGIENMSGLFAEAPAFNRPVDTWVTDAVTNMSETFLGASLFNEPLDNWRVNNVTDMSFMFSGASRFNRNISNWNTTKVTNMSGTFRYTGSFNQTLNNWVVDNVTDMSNMFEGSGYNLPLNIWNVDAVTNMSGMFSQYSRFNQDISMWTVSAVTDMSRMFHRATTFNQPLNGWDVSNVTNMSGMFDGFIATMIFNQPLNGWDVSKVEDMSNMFRDCKSFNQPLDLWVVDSVTDMSGMFEDAEIFDQDITGWDVSAVTDMSRMFQDTDAFNQPINIWTPTVVTNLSSMFSAASQFNQPLDSWSVGLTNNFQYMFRNATLFNQDLSGWVTDSATNMSGMFQNATAFDLDLGSWNISNVSAMNNMLSNSGLSQANYDSTLIAWATQTVRDNVSLGATGLNYCDALDERQDLIDNSNWNITGDIVNCSFVLCTELVSPIDGDTNVPASANLTWQQTPGATGYYVTVRIIRGGVESTPFNDHDVIGGNIVGLNLENGAGDDLLEPGDDVFVTIVPYNDTDGRATGCTEESFTVVPSWVNSPDAFKLTYDTRILESGTTAANQLKIERNNNFSYDYSIDWGDDQFNNHVTNDITHTYLTPGIYTVSIIGNFPAPEHYYSNTDAIKLISIDQWGTQAWQSMELGFYYCENMEYNATDIPDLAAVESMASMFAGCALFNGNLNSWNVSNVTDMSYLFIAARVFNQPLDQWDVSNVENMSGMFFACNEFDQPIGNWLTSSVTNTSRMFNQASVFNRPLNDWDLSKVTNTYQMFTSASAFNQPLDEWDVSQVTDMSEMFARASAFDQPIEVWNVGNVTNMGAMFSYAEVFDQPLNEWDVSKVTNMASMFSNALDFNQPLDEWEVDLVTNMGRMFSRASTFNQDINIWNVTNVIDMNSMFDSAVAYNRPMADWDVNSVVNMQSMFRSAEVFDQPLNEWEVSAVANMTSMFENALVFDQPLNLWDVSSVTLMPSMFEGAETFNNVIGNWNVASVTNMKEMFKEALIFDQAIENWNTGEVLDMEEMFKDAAAFNQHIDPWDVSFVRTMEGMFEGAITFDQPLNSWNVASVTTMEDMFKGATAFDQDINPWNVRGVDTMEEMFSDATSFNKSINNWRVTGVSNMDYMFDGASTYNQDMSLWNLGNVTMRSAFNNAIALNQNLADWDVSGVTDMRDMLDNTALTRENYDNTLIAWSEQTLTNGITLGAEGLPYCDALEERQSMIDTFGWTFSLDVRDCPIPACTQLASPMNNDIDVPVNTNITWDPAVFARGYRLTVGTSAGGNDIVNDQTINDETSFEFASDFDTGDTVFVTIIPFNDEGDAVGPCIEESFTISSDPATIPDCTDLTEPALPANDVLVTSDLSWNPISNADGYKITVGTSAGADDLLNEDVGNVITYDLDTDLPEDSDIFVTVTPYNDEGEPICTEEQFHTELIPVPPTCTNLISPEHDDIDVPIDTDLSWAPVSNATGYLVVVGTTSGGIEVVNNVDVDSDTTYDIPDDLLESRLYYVTIIPYNDEGDATGCIEETFTTGDSTSPPSCTELTTPSNLETGVSPSTNLTWTGLGTATGYNLTVGTASGGTEIFTGDVNNVTTYDLATDLPESTPIYVTVTPYNDNGDAAGPCTEVSFTTDGPPLCSTLNSPRNNDTDVVFDLSGITWNASTNADGYKLTITASSSTANNETDLDIRGATTHPFTDNFERGETVTVTIIPYNDAIGDAVGPCASESFTIIPPPVPACTTLSSTLTDVALRPTIEWNTSAGADGYKLTVTASSSTANNETELDIPSGTAYTFTDDFEQGETVDITIVPNNDQGDAIGCTVETITIKPVPLCNELATPRNLDIDVPKDISRISWDAVSNATGYRVSVSAENSTANNVTNELITIGNTYDFLNDFEPGELVTVTIIPFNESGDAIACENESFTIKPLPACTNLTTPINGDIDVVVETDIAWTAISDANGYNVIVAASSSTANNGTFDVTIGNSYTFSNNFEQGETVTVTIVPYNDAGDALGCSSESFTIESVPDCSNLTSPTDGEVLVNLNEITWNVVDNSDGYKLTITSNNSTANNITDLEVTDTTYTFPNDFNQGEFVTVTVTPFNHVGDATGCTSESFTIRPLPNCTNLSNPLNQTTEVFVGTDITWNASNDADGYRISVGTSPNGNDIVNNEDVASLTSYTFASDLPSETLIYVTIVPYNTSGDAVGCTSDNFTTEIIAPECAVMTSPANGEVDVPLESSINWSEVEKTNGYRISIGTTSGGTDILDNLDMGAMTSYNHSGELPFDTEIFVSIIAYNSVGDSEECEIQSFTTIIPEDNTKYGFSPDGDGINEYWHIENIEYYPENMVTIYNRWGDAVFKIDNYDNGSEVFRGEANQKTKMGAGRLPSGTYFFDIQIEGQTILKKTKGYLVIKR